MMRRRRNHLFRPATIPSTVNSEESDDDISPIADVFADSFLAPVKQMLNMNEDMVVAAAECHAEKDVKGAIAYQRILHRNLLEMASFIDSMFGVYNNNTAGTDTSVADGNEQLRMVNEQSNDITRSSTLSEDNGEFDAAVSTASTTKPSVVIDTLVADEKLREIQRSKKMWIKSRQKVQQEESVSAIMNDAAERIVTIAAAANVDSTSSSAPSQAQPVSQNHQPSEAPKATDTTATTASTLNVTTNAPTNPVMPAFPTIVSAAMPPQNVLGLPSLLPSTGIVLPPANSALNLFFPMAPPLFPPPLQLATICRNCAPLKKSVFECRTVLKHVAPPLFLDQTTSMMGMQWPQPLQMDGGGRSMLHVRAPAKMVFKRMCEECRKCHYSLHRCRVALQHTAPEWQPDESAPKKRKRRNKTAKVS